jgi:hypothetical protein
MKMEDAEAAATVALKGACVCADEIEDLKVIGEVFPYYLVKQVGKDKFEWIGLEENFLPGEKI